MLDGFDENELLAYIEGELAPRQRRALEARLDAEPAVRAAVDRMGADRRSLRSLGEPELPRDLVADLEPQLARPMLFQNVAGRHPGAYRRRHAQAARRPVLARVLARAAVAAMFVGALGGGLWAVVRFGPAFGPMASGNTAPQLADADSNAAGTNAGASGTPGLIVNPNAYPADGTEPWPPPGSLVHHAAPQAGRIAVADEAPRPETVSTGPVLVMAAFRLELASTRGTDAEGVLAAALAPAGASTTAGGPELGGVLVRNFTQEEADLLLAELLAAPTGQRSPRVFADLEPEEVERRLEIPIERNRAVAKWLREARAAEARRRQAAFTSGVVAGAGVLAPSYEMQLELSAAGASHAITVPLSDLADFLARLQLDQQELTVRIVTDGRGADGASGSWIESLPVLTAWLAELRRTATEAHHVVIPVAVTNS